MTSELIQGDCLEEMPKLIARGIKFDAIIADIPYGTTSCPWDSVIPFNKYIMIQKSSKSKNLVAIYRDDYILQEIKNGRDYHDVCDYFDEHAKDGMWQCLNQLIKPNGAIVLFGSEPFSTKLRNSNLKNYRYDWKWDKVVGSNFIQAKKQPLKIYEDIMVFYEKQCLYNPQMTERNIKNERVSGAKKQERSNINSARQLSGIKNTKLKYPVNKIEINRLKNELNSKHILHPTQKPVELMEYLVKTYTNEGESVLDFTMGSNPTGKACKKLNRNYVGIEKDKDIFNIAQETT